MAYYIKSYQNIFRDNKITSEALLKGNEIMLWEPKHMLGLRRSKHIVEYNSFTLVLESTTALP